MLTSHHHLVRDTVQQLAIDAGWKVTSEQLVTIACTSPTAPEPCVVAPLDLDQDVEDLSEQRAVAAEPLRGASIRKRADLVCVGSAGISHVLDVVVTHNLSMRRPQLMCCRLLRSASCLPTELGVQADWSIVIGWFPLR